MLPWGTPDLIFYTLSTKDLASSKFKVLRITGLKDMTVISLPWNLHLALTSGSRCQQVTSAIRRRLLLRQSLVWVGTCI